MTDPTTSGDLLAWLDTAIRRRENTARAVGWDTLRSSDYGPGTKYLTLHRADQSKNTPAVDAGLVDHIVLHDPAAVLRRCAADRKMLELHGDRCHSCPAKNATGYLDEWTQFDYGDVCPVVQLLAEGYGWTADA